MEGEGRSPSSFPPPLSEADICSNFPRDQVLQEAAAQSAADPLPEIEPAASQALQDRGLRESTFPSSDDPPIDDDADSHTTQIPGLQEAIGPSAANLLSDDLRDQIVRQVEYYFSDANLPTDKFLLKYVKRDKEGFVPITVISSFRRMKKIVQDLSPIVAALRTSSQLVVSLDGKRVKRLHPLPVTEIKDTKSRTILVENLPEDCSTDRIRIIFGKIGNILNITIRDPHSIEKSTATRKAEMAISSKLHALIEYETVEAAESAVATLNDQRNWRSGMRVELLLNRMGKYGLIQRGRNESNSEKSIMQAADKAADGQKSANGQKSAGHDEMARAEEEEHFVGGKGERSGRYRGRGRGHLQQNANGHGHGYTPSSSSSEGASKPLPGPRMPDGTRGFTMGRDKISWGGEHPLSDATLNRQSGRILQVLNIHI